MDEEMTPVEARAALHAAADRAATMRARARWASTKLALYGLGFGAVTVAIGLTTSRVAGAVVFLVWAAFVAGMVLWERSRLAHLAGTHRRIGPYWTGTVTLYAVVVALGAGEAVRGAAFWVVAGLVVATPMVVGAVRERTA